MSAVTDMERKILEAIREWIEREHLTQQQAAERLQVTQSHLNALLRGRRRHSLNYLLQAWEASGGAYTFTVFRIEEVTGDHHIQAALSD